MWIVVDCEFNRFWYAELIGKVFEIPPSYARVKRI
jgi:hypothetical protein